MIKQFKSKNQFVIEEKGKTTFQSYDSTIAILEVGELTFGEDWQYSRTTLKYLYLFLKEYTYRNDIELALESKNKKKALQDLIDNGIIHYDETL